MRTHIFEFSHQWLIFFCAETTPTLAPDMTSTLISGTTTDDSDPDTTTDSTGQLTPSFLLCSITLLLTLGVLVFL